MLEPNTVLTKAYGDNVALMDSSLRINGSFDLKKRSFAIGRMSATLYYVEGFTNSQALQKLMSYWAEYRLVHDETDAETFLYSSLPVPDAKITSSVNDLVFNVMSGRAVLLGESFGDRAVVIDTRTYPTRSIDEPENDRVMRGSRDGLVETLMTNVAMIRRRIRDPDLSVKHVSAGRKTKTDIALCYLTGKADENYVAQLSEKLEKLDTDSIVLGHQNVTETLIRTNWYNPFPKVRATERPDSAAAAILEGRIILLCDNSPEALIFPTSLFDFLQVTDDYYFPPLTGSYLRILRQVIFWLTVYLIPVWYLLLRHHSFLPDRLGFLIPADPGDLPIYLQILLTEFAIDGLKLASLNTPSMMTNSLSIVGGLLLGDIAVKVGWVSPDVILYMSFVAIANFTQTSFELGYAFKYLRVLTLTLAVLFDVWGFIAAVMIAIFLILTNKTANGKRNYLYPLIPFNGRALLRLMFRMKKDD